MPLHIACVLGTRPEAIKLAPIALAARSRSDRFDVTIVATGQHRDMAGAALASFGLVADVDLGVMEVQQHLTEVLARVLMALPPVLRRIDPDVVLVQGDTTSTLAGALCGYHGKIPVGHVEAGLRTDDRYSPFPEEMNRRIASAVATFHFAPTELARRRLLGEGTDSSSILMSGNTVIDALYELRTRARPPAGIPRDAGLRSRLILLTCHRRENHGERMGGICAAAREIVRARSEVTIVCPVHLNPDVQARMRSELAGIDRIVLLPPVDYEELLWLLDRSVFVLTDSGGLQEEAPAYRKPVLVLRDVTERPEGVEAGIAQLVGTEPTAIVRESLNLLDTSAAYGRMATGENPYGDGRAAGRILDFLLVHVPAGERLPRRPAVQSAVTP